MRLGVVGAGAWGTALAHLAAAQGPVTLWARDPGRAEEIARTGRNEDYLPGIDLPPAIRATADRLALAACDALLLVTPAQAMRGVLAAIPSGATPLVLCSKGIEAGTRLLMSEVARELRPDAPIAVLSGPTFAHEVAAGLPTAVTLACDDGAFGERLAARLARPSFRPYRSDDVIGAEVGGAVKNVLAIASGVVAGVGLGQNAAASLIARGFAEMARFGAARGADPAAMTGLAGLGDLVLTCSSPASRNYALGFGLGQRGSAADLLAGRRTIVEGAATAPVLIEAARAVGVEMPIAEAVRALLAGEAGVEQAVERLLHRPLAAERP